MAAFGFIEGVNKSCCKIAFFVVLLIVIPCNKKKEEFLLLIQRIAILSNTCVQCACNFV
jgi:hypothetical protein